MVYDGKASIETTGLAIIKSHLDSTISTEGAKYIAADMRNFYTNLKLDSLEYISIHLCLIQEEIIDEYCIMNHVHDDGYMYVMFVGVIYKTGYTENR